jgi:GTP1/Obg family GTP-binding protein
MSKEHYKKQIVDLRAKILKEKEAKKRDNENYARNIKNATSPTSKASYRKAKIDRAASHTRTIENYKKQIENCKTSIQRLK